MKLHDSLERLIESPLTAASGIIAAICSGYGIIEAGEFVDKQWGSKVLSIAASACLVLCLIPFLLRQLIWNLRRRFHLPEEERFIYSRARREWSIKASGEASLETENVYLFFKPPEKEDLVDTFFASEALDEARTRYKSPDARIVDTERIDDKAWKFYWQSNSGSIQTAKEYEHSYSTEFPLNKKFTSKSFTIAVPVFTLSYCIEIQSELPVLRYFCYPRRPWQPFHGHEQIVRRAQTVKRRLAPSVQKIDDHRLVWEAEYLKSGETYYIVLLFEGQNVEKKAA